MQSALRFFDGLRYELIAHAVMDDHVHVVVRPFQGFPLERAVQSWKGFTGRKLKDNARAWPVWQKDYFDRIVRDERDWAETVAYVLFNPDAKWQECSRYAWSDSVGEWDL